MNAVTTMLETDLSLLDFAVEDPGCENENCAFGYGPVRFRQWFEPVCKCGVSLVCEPCAKAMLALASEECPMQCRDCGAAYETGRVGDYLRLERLAQ